MQRRRSNVPLHRNNMPSRLMDLRSKKANRISKFFRWGTRAVPFFSFETRIMPNFAIS
jgi:hypothetical protein